MYLSHFSNGLLDYRKTGEMKRKQRKRKIRKVLEEEIDKTRLNGELVRHANRKH